MDQENVDSNQLFDSILKEIGGFGRYQKFLLALSFFSSILCACNHLSPIYLTYTPDYECIEGDSNQTIPNITKVKKPAISQIIHTGSFKNYVDKMRVGGWPNVHVTQ